MAGNRNKVFVGLVLVASLSGLLWRLQRSPVPPASVVAVPPLTNAPPRPEIEPHVPPLPFGATTNFMRYELLADQQVWGSVSLLPGFWGYTNRVEVPDVTPRDLLLQNLGEPPEGLLPSLAAVRVTSDWNAFLQRWVDPRLTQSTGLGIFNPEKTFEGLTLMPAPKDPGISFGLKYRWSF